MTSLSTVKIPVMDLRTESTFRKSIAPSTTYVGATALALRDQMIYPLLQGFAWAVCKDWLVIIRAAAIMRGHNLGKTINAAIAALYAAVIGAPGPAAIRTKRA